MSASMCASAVSLLAPDTPCRSRYRAACNGLTAYTVYPAAISACTHGPRSVSIPTTTSAGVLGVLAELRADHRVQPGDPGHALGQPRLGQPAARPRPSPRRRDGPRPSHLPRTATRLSHLQSSTPSAACGRTISDLMNQCSRHHRAGTTSHQRSALPADRQGHDLSIRTRTSRVDGVLTRRRLPAPSLPDDRLASSH